MLELTLTVLSTTLPLILAAVIILEIYEIIRISNRTNYETSRMESTEFFKSIINSITDTRDSPPEKDASFPLDLDFSSESHSDSEDDDFEPIVVTSFDFAEEESEASPGHGATPVKEEKVPFGDISFQDASFSDFEIVVTEDGSFELKKEDEEATEE